MGRPIKIASATALQEMSDENIDAVADLVLHEFATNEGSGWLYIGGNTGNVIGSYTNTVRNDAVGTHPTTGATTVTTTDIKQDQSATAESFTRPIEIDGARTGFVEQVDGSLNGVDSIINRCLSKIIQNGIGAWVLSSTTPHAANWTTSNTSITDTIVGGTSVTYKLHRNTTTPSALGNNVRPLRINFGESGLIEMSDENIRALSQRLRNQIVATGIGTYAFQENAPAAGTWIQAGDTIIDRLRNVENRTYTGNYIRYYAGRNAGTFTGNYTGATIVDANSNENIFRLWRRTA